MSEIMEYYSKSESEKSKITELVEELKEKMPFQNEAQFQHALAMAIDKDIEESNKPYEVLLEVWTGSKALGEDKSDKRNCYTDIVILDAAKKEYLAIELKYKTAKLEMVTKGYGDISLKEQGANDYGCYDYLWDVQRIGDLISGENKEGNLKECRCVGGYAIFLTNEKKYWTYTREGRVDKNGYYDFCIGDGSDDDRDNDRSIKKNRPLEWHSPGDPQKEGTRKYAITLSDKYLQEKNFDWGEERNPFWTAPKESEGARKFRYLCLTLKPN